MASGPSKFMPESVAQVSSLSVWQGRASCLQVQPEHSRVHMHALASHGPNACAGRRSQVVIQLDWFWRFSGAYSGFRYIDTPLATPACQHGSPTQPALLHRVWAGSWMAVGNHTAVHARPSWLCEASRPSAVAQHCPWHGPMQRRPLLTMPDRHHCILPVPGHPV